MVTCQAGRSRSGKNPDGVTLHLSEADVERLLSPGDAVEAIEACFRRMAAGAIENRPRYRLPLERGALAVMAASDLELGYAGAKVYAGFAEGARFVVTLFRTGSPELVAVIDADKLGQLRTGAATHDGEEAVLGSALMLAGENSRLVARAVAAKLRDIAPRLPELRHRVVMGRPADGEIEFRSFFEETPWERRHPVALDDAREDPALRENDAIRDLDVIAYAGIPLIGADGHALGTLCVIDHRPRHWRGEETTLLQEIANAVVAQVEAL